MKELSVEEKAKAYDEIIKKANKMHHENCEACQMCIEELIPELKESEDERIRKAIINVFANHKDYEVFFGASVKDILAWLEKQDKQKFEQKFFINDKVVHKVTGKIWTIHYYLKDTNSYYVEDNDGLLHHYRESELELVEQKPAWSEENDRILQGIWRSVDFECLSGNGVSEEDAYDLLSFLKDSVKSQPKQEWNEEDKNMLKWVTEYLNNKMLNTPIVEERTACKNAIAWLEKLKDEQKPVDKVEPKFKVGQTIKKKYFNLGFTIVKIEEGFYYNNMGDYFPFTDQDNWELVESVYKDLKKLKE